MKILLPFLLTIAVTASCHAADLIEKSWFSTIDGMAYKAEYIDLNTNNTERLYIRYSPISDSGVELERTTNNVVLWRTHVQSLGVAHSKYCHAVNIILDSDQIIVFSAGGLDVCKNGNSIYANSDGAKQIHEIHSLKTGKLISRKVSNMLVQIEPHKPIK
jgi:hypothetical protein